MRKGTCGWEGAPLVTSPTIPSYSKLERIPRTPSTIPTEPSESSRTSCFCLDISSRRLLQSVTIRRRRQIQPSESPQRPPPGFGLAGVGGVLPWRRVKSRYWGWAPSPVGFPSLLLVQVGVVGRLCTTTSASTDTTIPSIIARQVKKSQWIFWG